MAEAAEQLVVSLEARIREFERNFQRANRTANDNWRQIERRSRTGARNLENAMSTSTNAMSRSLDKFGTFASGKLKGAFAAIAAGVTLNELRKTADEYTKIMNTLRVAGVNDGDLGSTFDKLFQSAQRNAAPLDSLATLYGRVSAAQTTLKASSQEVMQVTDITAQALRVSGTSASEAQGALLQLGQALAGGKIQAEEYNSLLDGMRPLLEAAAAGLQEAGGDVAKLTALVKDGKVSSEAFFRAILAGAPILEEKLAGSVVTTEQAMQRLQNEFVKAVGEFDKATGASQALAGAIDGLAGSIGGIGTAATNAVVGVQKLIATVGELAKAHAGAQRAAALTYQDERAARVAQAREMGLANAGGREKLAAERAAADAAATAASRQAVSSFRASEIDYSNRLTTTTLPPARPKGAGASIKPVSLADYAAPGDTGKGGGAGGSGAEKQSRFERDIEAIGRRTRALELEAQMVGKGREEVERSKIALQLEEAAKRDGITITDDMRRSIDAAAQGYANAKLKVEDLKTAMDGVRDAQKFFATEITDSFIDLVVEGKNATEVVQQLGKALLKAALQAMLMGSGPLAGLFGTAGANGAVGGILGFLPKLFGFADGGYTGPGAKYQPAGIVHAGEYVMSKAATSRIGVQNLERMHRGALRGFADGGYVGSAPAIRQPDLASASAAPAAPQFNISAPITVNGSAGTPEQNNDLAKKMAREMEVSMRSVIADEVRKQGRPGNYLNTRSR